MKITVNVHFDGAVEADVPNNLNEQDARLLAEHLVLARVLATLDNPDAPEDDALGDYEGDCSEVAKSTAEQDWDTTKLIGVWGEWTGEVPIPEKLDDGKMITVELGIAYGDAEGGNWETDDVDISRNTPEHAIEEVAIGQYRTEHPGEYAHLWLYHYSYDDIVEEDKSDGYEYMEFSDG